MKTCANCKLEKPLEAFAVNRTAPDGKQRYCRDCNNSYGAFFRKSKTKNMRFRVDARDYLKLRPLSESEVDALVSAVNQAPQRPIRLKVSA